MNLESISKNIDGKIETDLLVEHMWNNITFEIFLKFVALYFIIIWIAIVVWVIKDITNRTNNVILEVISILTVTIFTPFGIFIYLLIRPGKTLLEKHYSDIEENLDAFSDIIKDKVKEDEETLHCFKCREPLSQEFKFCPNCKVDLSMECKGCERGIYPGWKHCPYCGKENKVKPDSKVIHEKKGKEEKNESKKKTDEKKLIA